MYDRSLNLIITTPFNDFLKQQEKIESYIEQLENFRNCSENRVSIDFVITEFRFILSIINDMNRVISSTPHRGKREAYFPVVGTVFEIFFGSASEDTTNKLWNNLKKAENRMSALSDTMFKDHGSTVRLLSSIQEKNTDTDSRIKQMLSKLNELVEQQNSENNKFFTEIQISRVIQTLSMVTTRYRSVQNKICAYLIQQRPANIDLAIIPFATLKRILNSIDTSTINQSETMPWKSIDEFEIYHYLSLIPMKLSVVNGCIVTEILIPLVLKEGKEIYEAIPAPSPLKSHLIVVKTEAPYFVTNRERSEIGYMSNTDLSKCWSDNADTLICPRSFPVHKQTDYNHFCELAILSNEQEKSDTCNTQIIDKNDLFIKTGATNQFYYVIRNKCFLRANCNENITDITLTDTGLITINDGCYVFNTNIQIMGQSLIDVKHTDTFYTSNFSIPVRKFRRTLYQFEYNDSNIALLNKNFEQLKNDIIVEQKKNHNDIKKMHVVDDSSNSFWSYLFNFETYINLILIASGLLTSVLAVLVTCYKIKKIRNRGVNVSLNVNQAPSTANNPNSTRDSNNNRREDSPSYVNYNDVYLV